MKKTTVFIFGILFSVCAYSQKSKLIAGSYSHFKDNGDKITYSSDSKIEMRLNSTGDTIEIYPASKIKAIKIDGKVYEIIRSTELKEITPFSVISTSGAVLPNYFPQYYLIDTVNKFKIKAY